MAVLKDAFGRMGPVNGGLYLLSRLLDRLGGGRIRLVKYYIVAQPVGLDEVAKVRPDASTQIDPALPGSPVVRDFPRPEAVIQQRFQRGAECHVAMVKGVFAGFLWLCRGAYDEDEVRCRFVLMDAARSAWDFDVYVEPRFRLGRTMARLWQAADQRLADQGVAWTFSRISAFNPDSLAAHGRLGIVKCHSVLFMVFGRLQLSLLPQWPYVHLSTSDLSPPEIRLSLPGVHRM
ncbi:GNAT family N-acetyltransferase [Chitinimonas naiadis]